MNWWAAFIVFMIGFVCGVGVCVCYALMRISAQADERRERSWQEQKDRQKERWLHGAAILIVCIGIFGGCSSTRSTQTTTETTRETEVTVQPPPISEMLPVRHDSAYVVRGGDPVPTGRQAVGRPYITPIIVAEKKKKGKPFVKVTYYPDADSMEVDVQPEAVRTKAKETTTTTKTKTQEIPIYDQVTKVILAGVLFIVVAAIGWALFSKYRKS